MSLKYILLGLLREPQSGYDIKKQFNQSLRNFWNANLSQIYPQLQKLENDGLLTSKQIESATGPPRRVYKRTSKGRRELERWLMQGPKVGEERIAYLAQVYFLGELKDDEQRLRFMHDLRAHMAEWLETLRDVERRWSADDPRYPDELPDSPFYSQLTLDLGLKRISATIEWCD